MIDRNELPFEFESWLKSEPDTPTQPDLVAAPHTDVPTLLLAAGIYAAFFAVTWFYHALSWWIVLPAGVIIVCLQSSLQHEAMHGYPTRRAWLNYLIAAPALWLWLPYGVNRDHHLRHHINENLTDPTLDPESNYVARAAWQRMSPLHRKLREAMATLAGRIVIGPIYYAFMSARGLIQAIRTADRIVLGHWALHGLVLVALAWWVVDVNGISPLDYVLFFAWPGTGLALIRSYAEHRAAPDVPARTATVEAGPFMSFLFLHNNLHALHHAQPTLAWHQRPQRYRAMRKQLLGESRYHLIDGYASLFRNYLLDAKEPLLHPASARGERSAVAPTRDRSSATDEVYSAAA
jgi:fatty acid desaturase